MRKCDALIPRSDSAPRHGLLVHSVDERSADWLDGGPVKLAVGLGPRSRV